MNSSNRLDYLRLLIAIAWSDGSLAVDEQEAIQSLVNGSRTLSPSEREAARGALCEEPSEFDITAQIERLATALMPYPKATRHRLYRSCVLLSQLGSREVPPATQAHIDTLQHKLF